MNMEASKLRQVITDIQRERNAIGTFFSAKNVKKDGSVRTWLCRLGVRKGDRGGELPYVAADHNLITVWDKFAFDKGASLDVDHPRAKRQINVSTLTDLQVCGIVLMKNGVATDELKKRLS